MDEQTAVKRLKEVWDYAKWNHRDSHRQFNEIRSGEQSLPKESLALTSSMLILRDIGRIVQGIAPASDDGNPFDRKEIDF